MRHTPSLPRLNAVAAPARRWTWMQASVLPLLAAGVLLALGGCGTMNERGSNTSGGTAIGASANLWSRPLEHKREALSRASAGTGAVVVKTADNQLKLIIPADFSFEAGRSELKPAARPLLDELARGLDDEVRVTVVGHTDSVSPVDVNDQLSQDRAEAVREYLVHHGVQRGRLLVEGRGARQPVVSNATEAGRAANRRIEIFLSQPAS